MSIFFTSMLPNDDGFFSLIRSLRMLTFLFFGISIVKVRSGSSPRRKQLRDRSWVESRATTVWTSLEEIKCGSKEKIVAAYLAPLL